MTNPLLFSFAAAVAVLGLQSPSPAQDVPTVRIGIGDLNLLSAADKAVLARRIKVAVDKVCGPPSIPLDLAAFTMRTQCRSAAHVGAYHQVAVLTDRLRADIAMRDKPSHADGAALASR